MRFQDAFRAQYYLAFLEERVAETIEEFTHFSFLKVDLAHILAGFCSELSRELDQILLPTIVHEIHKARNKGYLKGKTASDRYTSFFIDQKEGVYTSFASNIVGRYPFLFEMVDEIITQSFLNLRNCLRRFGQDYKEIKYFFQIEECLVESIKILSSSDRHRSQQALLLSLSGNIRVIYKPVDLYPDRLFDRFVSEIDLPDSYNLMNRRVLPKINYGWLEYISTKHCHSLMEIESFYRRMGALLAISDTVNYSDGHCENILACGAFPLLLDAETLFQNYVMPISERKSIISTHMIQKFQTMKSDSSKYSALQSTEAEKVHSLFTHAIHDHTDDIRVSYRGFTNEINHHRPFFDGRFYNSSEFIEEVIDGYCFAYKQISRQADQLLQMHSWWEKVSSVRSRIVVRDTGAYFYLQRKIQQPEYCKSKRKAENYLRNKLGDTPYTDYEVKDTLALNIPYFYQKPNERHLYDGDNHAYPNIFPNTAMDWMRKQLKERSEDIMQHNCAVIRTYLPKKSKKLEYELI